MVKLRDKLKKALKNRAIVLGGNSMYKSPDRQTPHLFEELFPFGGKLDSKNRWLKKDSRVNSVERIRAKIRSIFFRSWPARYGRAAGGGAVFTQCHSGHNT